MIRYHVPEIRESKVIRDTDMISVQTARSGIFEAQVTAGEHVRMGQPLANILHPYEGSVLETLYAPAEREVFFVHNEPLTYADTAVIKLV